MTNLAFIAIIVATLCCTLVAGSRRPLAGQGPPANRWRRQFPTNTTFGDPALFRHDGSEYLAVYTVNNTATTVVVMSTADGSVLWNVPIVNPPLAAASGWVAPGEAVVDGARTAALFVGTVTGITALRADNGATIWTHNAAVHPPVALAVPAHPTFAAGRVFFTFESGRESAPLVVLNATTGTVEWALEAQEHVITLIWHVAAVGGIAYCVYNSESENAFVFARSYNGTLLWQHGPIAHSAPGLWDNPNLDVDAVGRQVFMYAKPHAGLREVTSFESTSGEPRFVLTAEGPIPDYDTFAWDGDFFRLMVGENATHNFVERVRGTSAAPVWTANTTWADVGSNLLVCGGGAFVFGSSTNTLWAFDAASGAPLWTLPNVYQPSTGITTVTQSQARLLLFGDGLGVYRAIQWA